MFLCFVEVQAQKVFFFSFVSTRAALLPINHAESVKGLDKSSFFDLDHIQVELNSLNELAIDLLNPRGLLEVLD